MTAPRFVFLVTHALTGTSGGGDGEVGVFATAQLARGCARTYGDTPDNYEGIEYEGADEIADEFTDMSGKELRAACKAAGSLSTSGVLEDMRERLRRDKESKQRGRIHAELLKGAARGVSESDIDAAVEKVHAIEWKRESDAAFEAFWDGKDNIHLFNIEDVSVTETWNPDGTGFISMHLAGWTGGRHSDMIEGTMTVSREPVRTSL
jgi:hypothetical protein